jgi:hypothetical protein
MVMLKLKTHNFYFITHNVYISGFHFLIYTTIKVDNDVKLNVNIVK